MSNKTTTNNVKSIYVDFETNTVTTEYFKLDTPTHFKDNYGNVYVFPYMEKKSNIVTFNETFVGNVYAKGGFMYYTTWFNLDKKEMTKEEIEQYEKLKPIN